MREPPRGSQDPAGSSSLRLWEAEMKAGSEGTSASISCFSPGSWMRKDPRNVKRFTSGHTVRQYLGSLHLQLHPSSTGLGVGWGVQGTCVDVKEVCPMLVESSVMSEG